MATAYLVSCDCGFTGRYSSQAKADFATRRHSCRRWLEKSASAARGRLRDAKVDRNPKPCHHKFADHQHGTYACYTLDACRCQPCRDAVRTYEQNRTRQQAYGRWDNLVDAQPARDHVRRLMAAGMGMKRIGAAADVGGGSLWKLLYGRVDSAGVRRQSRRLTKAVSERLLAVELDLADGAYVPNTDTARRLQALVANGWSMSKLGAFLDVQPGNFNPVITGARRKVTVATAKRVHALYIELADQAPPEDIHQNKSAATRARNLAARNGWAQPLRIGGRLHVGATLSLPDLDDCPVIDLGPGFDEAAVTRRLGGDRSTPVTKADRIEIVRRARAAGWSYLDLERRAGINKPDRYLTDTQDAS